MGRDTPIRFGGAADAPAFGRLLHTFNAEFGDSSVLAELIAERAAPLIESGDVTVHFSTDAAPRCVSHPTGAR